MTQSGPVRLIFSSSMTDQRTNGSAIKRDDASIRKQRNASLIEEQNRLFIEECFYGPEFLRAG